MAPIAWSHILPLFVLSAMLESVGQISFKKAAVEHRETRGLRYYLALGTNKWLLAGIVSYAGQMAVWVFLLSRVPLSVAFPVAGLQQVFILVASYAILKEQVRYAEWFGAGLIVVGLSVIVRS